MLAAATVAAAAEVPAVGAAAAGDCVPLGPKIIFGKGNVLRLRGGASHDAPDGSRSDVAHALRTPHGARRVGSVRKKPVKNAKQRQRLAARKLAEHAAQRAAAVDSDTEDPDINLSGSAAEWSTEDMAAAMAKITELEAATVQLEADKAELEASVRAKDTTLGDVAEMSLKVPSTSGIAEEPAAVYAARLAQLAARRAKKGAKTVSSAPVVGESAEPRRPKPFTGEGDQDQAGAVRRFCNALSLFFELSNTHPDDWALHGRTYLDGTAADYMHTAMHALPKIERTWATFCALLGTRLGQIDPDTEFWDQLKDLKEGSLPAAQYVHKMQYCFNGITELPISPGEKIQRFMDGLNPTLKRLVTTAPFGMGRHGKWLDPNQLMSYTVTQAQGLPNGGAVGPAASSPLVSQSGHKRSHGHDGNGTAHAKGKKLKRKDFSKRAGSNSGGKDSFPP